MKYVVCIAAGAILGFFTVATAAEVMLHSGTVVAVDRAAGTIAMDERTPGHVGKASAAVTRITMRVSPHTKFIAARRADDGRDWPGGFLETSLPGWTIKVGDSVTALCQHEGPFLTTLTALEIWVAANGYELP